ncbi:hypothetical protein PCANB_000247 [Pneumocystis canis]|nr:hypothetical protein PCK1_000110 [Pneumocystis canis]KAG5439965.1 hypothetical protein PCANB_000247 [Pneumocystis canis]
MLKTDVQNKREKRASGIKSLEDGNSIIPSSVRPDGSIRCERKVRPGYIPPEDISVYKVVHNGEYNRRATNIRPGIHGYCPPGVPVFSNLSKSAKKRAKQKGKAQYSKEENAKGCSKQEVKCFSVIDNTEEHILNLKTKEIQKSKACSKNKETFVNEKTEEIDSLDTLVEVLECLEVSSS